MADEQLWGKAQIEGTEIVIRVGLEVLEAAITDPTYGQYRVTDSSGFAKDVVTALNREDSGGATAIHRLFDGGIGEALRDGSDHVFEITVANV